jgi:hypothetical protein
LLSCSAILFLPLFGSIAMDTFLCGPRTMRGSVEATIYKTVRLRRIFNASMGFGLKNNTL